MKDTVALVIVFGVQQVRRENDSRSGQRGRQGGIIQNLRGHSKEFTFYLESNRKPLKVLSETVT